MNKWIRDDLKKFMPYEEKKIPNQYKLNANESPYQLPDSIKKKFIKWIDSENLNTYPDTSANVLREKLAKHYDILPENITCGVGSDEIIDCITKGFLNIGEKVLVPTPSFIMYELTTIINRGKVLKFELDNNFDFDEDEIIKIANNENAKLIFLCNPNNPTGTIYDKSKFIKIIESVKAVVIIDEAYGEFLSEDLSFIKDIKKYKNIIILKTFSKAFGLAGLRIGFAVGDKEVIDTINIVKPPYNISIISQVVASFAVDNFYEYKERIDTIILERDNLINELKKLSYLKVYNSGANFIYIDSSKEIYNLLLEKGFLIRIFKDNKKGERLRITVGTPDTNSKLLKILKSI